MSDRAGRTGRRPPAGSSRGARAGGSSRGARAGGSSRGARTATAATPAARTGGRRRRRVVPEALTRGQRPFALVFVVLLVALATMAATPAQRYLEMQQRVDSLTHLRDELAADVDVLEDRKDRLHDPDEIELLARRELGLVRPDEVPYVIVRPGDDQPEVTPREPDPVVDDDPPWWRHLGETLGLLGDADDPS